MTVAGVVVPSPELTVTWTDSAMFARGGHPVGHGPKLAVNALAGVVGVGCGWRPLLTEGRAVLHECLDVDQATGRLPRACGGGPPEYEISARAPGFVGNTFALTGFSLRAGRMVALVPPATANSSRACG